MKIDHQGRVELIVAIGKSHRWLNWKVMCETNRVCNGERSSLISIQVNLLLKSWSEAWSAQCSYLLVKREIKSVVWMFVYASTYRHFSVTGCQVALRRAHGSDAGKQDLLPIFTLLSFNFNGKKKNMYINNSHSFLFLIVPIFITKFSRTTAFTHIFFSNLLP